MFTSIACRWNIVVMVSMLLSSFLIIMTACGSTTTTSTTPVPTATSAPTATPTDTPTPTPDLSNPLGSDAAKQVFTQMGTAIKNKDYTSLYSMTSAEYQATHTQQQMIDQLQAAIYYHTNSTPLTDFSIGDITITTRSKDNATVANTSMTFTFPTEVNTVNPSLIAENGHWKIADFIYNQR